jgi:glutathione S-transferase
MRLYGHPQNAGTRRVLLTLAEKEQTLELVQLDLLTGEHLRPAHLARHPFGKIPVLEEGSFVLCESSAIMRYLDETLSGPRLVPDTARERARMEQWLSADASYLAPALEPLLTQLVLHPMFGARPDPAEVARGRRDVAEVLDVLAQPLSGRDAGPFLAGSLFSLADIAFLANLQLLVEAGQEDLIVARPHVAGWWQRVRARPTAQNVLGHGGLARGPRRLRAVTGGLVEAC